MITYVSRYVLKCSVVPNALFVRKISDITCRISRYSNFCACRFRYKISFGLCAKTVHRSYSDIIANTEKEQQNESPQNSGLADVDINSITNGDPTLEKKLKILILEAEVLRQEGARIPSIIEPEQWKVLLDSPSRAGRRKYMEFLWKNEMKEFNEKRKKEEKKILREKYIAERETKVNEHITYALNQNAMFLRFYETKMNNFFHGKLFHAMMFGQKLVFDCGYEECMNLRESDNCAKQLMFSFSENREHSDPFDIHFCNVNKNSNTFKKLLRHIPTMYNPDFPMNITEKSYLDLFPKRDLVYLTPNAREELLEFDHTAVYIVGALIDRGREAPLSLAKAKRENLRIAKLPLDRYLDWGVGKKSLTLNQMILILLDVKKTGDWLKAFSHVPKRKLHQIETPEEHLRASSVMFPEELSSGMYRGFKNAVAGSRPVHRNNEALDNCCNPGPSILRGGWYMLGVQSLSVLCLASWTILTNFIILWVINKIIPIRMDPREELLGADLVEHHIRHAQVGVSRAMSALRPFVTEENLDKVTTIGYNPGHDAFISTNFYGGIPEIRQSFTAPANKRNKTAGNNKTNSAIAALEANLSKFPQKFAWLD